MANGSEVVKDGGGSNGGRGIIVVESLGEGNGRDVKDSSCER